MNKKLILSLTMTAIIAVAGFILVSNASAANLGFRNKTALPSRPGFEQMLEEKAELLGLTIDELKEALETKTLPELLEEKGITREDLQEKMRQRILERWRELGISEEEIQQRLEWQEQRREACAEEGCPCAFGKGMRMGLKRGFFFSHDGQN